MNYWCNTCGCYKGARGADECAVDSHSIVPAKDRELKFPTIHEVRLEIIQKLGYAPSSITSTDWIVARVQAERDAFKAEILNLKRALQNVPGTLEAVLHAVDPLASMKTWLPITIKECRRALGLKVPDEKPLTDEELELLRKSGFKSPNDPWPMKTPEIWEPKIGDRVWVSGKTWSMPGTITGWAKDDASVPWIKTDDGKFWDARDLGSVRKAKEEDRWDE